MAATAALLIHLISFPKKVQVHFGQDNQKISADGEVETVALLERKTDEDGYLIYQRLDYPSGESSEIFIAEELPDVSGLVNRAYPNFVPDRGELKTYW